MDKEYNSLLKLAKQIQEHFIRFYLAGGTALMLRHHHRVSIDLDFFSYRSFSFTHLAAKTRKLIGSDYKSDLLLIGSDCKSDLLLIVGE